MASRHWNRPGKGDTKTSMLVIYFATASCGFPLIYGFQVKMVAEVGRNIGRGLVAVENIDEAELIFRIPLKWIMHSDTLREHRVLKKVSHIIPGEVLLKSILSTASFT